MKKLLLILMPLSIVLAFYSFYLNKDLNFSTFTFGLTTLEFRDFDFTALEIALNSLNFTSYFEEATEWYEYIVALFNMLYGFINATVNLLVFFVQFITYLFDYLISFVKFLYNYIFS